MVRDITIVVILGAVLIALTFSYLSIIEYVWTGGASIHVAVWYGVLVLVCTAIGGALINRVWLGIVTLIILWISSVIFDVATASEASFEDVVISSLIPVSIQLSVFIATWWMAAKVAAHGQ